MSRDLSNEQIRHLFPEISVFTKLTYNVPFLRKLWGKCTIPKGESKLIKKYVILEIQHEGEGKEIL